MRSTRAMCRWFHSHIARESLPNMARLQVQCRASKVFVSTHLDHVLRNMGKRQIVMSGFITDQCVSSAVPSACDLGYLVTAVTDACASYSAERHTRALTEMKGYCRQETTDALCAEFGAP